jgi:hypothetical protein
MAKSLHKKPWWERETKVKGQDSAHEYFGYIQKVMDQYDEYFNVYLLVAMHDRNPPSVEHADQRVVRVDIVDVPDELPLDVYVDKTDEKKIKFCCLFPSTVNDLHDEFDDGDRTSTEDLHCAIFWFGRTLEDLIKDEDWSHYVHVCPYLNKNGVGQDGVIQAIKRYHGGCDFDYYQKEPPLVAPPEQYYVKRWKNPDGSESVYEADYTNNSFRLDGRPI